MLTSIDIADAAGTTADAGGLGTVLPHAAALGSIIDRLEQVEQRIREAEAERVALLAEAFDLAAAESKRIEPTPTGPKAELAYRAIRAEIAICLHQSEQTTDRQLSHAFTLTRDYRAVFDAYRSGTVSERHTAVITDAGAIIGIGDTPEVVARRAGYEEAVLPHALAETPGRLRPIARRLAEQFAERSLDERHAEARKQRRVYVVDAEDGMADLIAHLPATEAYGIYDRLTRIARNVRRAGSERTGSEHSGPEHSGSDQPGSAYSAPIRSRDEIRADALADLLLTGEPSENGAHENSAHDSGIRAQVQILLTENHLPTRADQERLEAGVEIGTDKANADSTGRGSLFTIGPPPPLLQGYGPIDTAAARRIAGTAAHWERVSEHPESGAILSVDRYRPSEEMRRLLGARDQRCRFPGCRVPLARCDIDHTVDAALGGSTATDNLAFLCRGHHTLKHHTGWSVEQNPGGVLEWRSPSGRTHVDLPPSLGFRKRSRVAFEF